MPKTVAVSDFKAQCLRLVDDVATRRHELVITKRGKPVARVVPIDEPGDDDRLARLRGTLIGGDRIEDFDTGLEWEATRR